MGKIGPSRQRYEVLPVPQWDLDDLVAGWRRELAPVPTDEAGTADVGARGGAPADDR